MRIQHNIAALNAHRQLGNNNNAVSKNLEKLSSGYKINRAGDDAAGLGISEKMRAQITGLETASKNAQDGVSLIQTAEGALTEVHSMLNRMVELSTQASNGVYGTDERNKMIDEVDQLRDEVDRIAASTNFNGKKLLDGSMSNGSVATGSLGATEIKMSAGFDFGTANMQLSTDDTGIRGINVTISTATGAFEIQLGTVAATSYTADEIKKAVATAAQTLLDSGNVTAQAGKDAVTALKSFDISFSGGKLSFGAGADLDTGAIGATATANATALSLQVGDTNDAFQKVTVAVGSMSSNALGLGAVNLATDTSAGASIQMIKDAIETVSGTRGSLGALQNRLDHTINNLGVTTENMTAAESRVRDVDMAKEMMTYTKNNILTQASQSMLAQANQLPQGVLQLLQ